MDTASKRIIAKIMRALTKLPIGISYAVKPQNSSVLGCHAARSTGSVHFRFVPSGAARLLFSKHPAQVDCFKLQGELTWLASANTKP
jgi:hypothetical protein